MNRRRARRRAVGAVLLLLGLVAAGVCAASLLDPAGATLADDGDPFGDPAPTWYPAPGLLASPAVAAGGVRLSSVAHRAAADRHRSASARPGTDCATR